MHYGLIVFAKSENTGDAIQSLAALQFLPHLDILVDRESLNKVEFKPELRVIGNAWYGHNVENWPPAACLNFLPISMHLSPRALTAYTASDKIDYLQSLAPIGARDEYTLKALRSKSIDAYLSGCLTLTLMPQEGIRRTDQIVLCDVDSDVEIFVRENSEYPIITVTHNEKSDVSISEKLTRAQSLLELYASAKCVITSRLHAALPSLAMGTPVFLIEAAEDSYRFDGLKDLVRHGSKDAFIKGEVEFDVNHPAPNSDAYHDMAAHLVKSVLDFILKSRDNSIDAQSEYRQKADLLNAYKAGKKREFAQMITTIFRHGEQEMLFGIDKNGNGGSSTAEPDHSVDALRYSKEAILAKLAELSSQHRLVVREKSEAEALLQLEKERSLALTTDLARLEIVREEINNQLQRTRTRADEADELQRHLSRAETFIEVKENRIADLTRSLEQQIRTEGKLRESLRYIQNTLSDQARTHAIDQERITALRIKASALEEKLQENMQLKDDIEVQKANLEKDLSELHDINTKIEQEKIEQKNKLEITASRIAQLEAEKEDIYKQLKINSDRLSDFEKMQDEYERFKIDYEIEKNNSISEQISSYLIQNKKLSSNLAAATSENVTLRDNIWRLSNKIADLELQKTNDAEKTDLLEGNLKSLRARLGASTAENITLRDNAWRLSNRVSDLEPLQQRIVEMENRLQDVISQKNLLEDQTAALPWRIINFYLRFRKFLPAPALRALGRLLPSKKVTIRSL